MASMISLMVATGRNGGDCAAAVVTTTVARTSSAKIRTTLLLVFLRLPKRIRRGHEEFSSIGECQIAAIDALQTVFSEITRHDDFRTDGQRVFVEASSEHRVGGACFDFPRFDGTVRGFHVDG